MRARGLTLIEISIALAIAALLVAVSVPAISSVTRAQLRQRSGQLAGGLRALYGESAIGGRSCRLILDLDKAEYQAECARGAVRLAAAGAEGPAGDAQAREREQELLSRARRTGETLSDEDRERLELLRRSAFAPSPAVPRTALGGQVRFRKVWVGHQPAPRTSGTAWLYFWPSGQTEPASIELSQGDDVVTLLVSPLTGRVRLVNGPAQAPGEPR